MSLLSRFVSSVPVMVSLVALLAAPLAGSESDGRGLAVIPPGYESFFAGVLGQGERLPGSCLLTAAGIDQVVVHATYTCAESKVAVELRHSEAALQPALSTSRFALVVVDGEIPAALAGALEQRLRAREADFEWSWTPLPGAEESTSYYSSIGAAAGLAFSLLAAALAVGWWFQRSLRPAPPAARSRIRTVVACAVLGALACGLVHAALLLTGSSFAASLRGEAATNILLRAAGVFVLSVASMVAIAALLRLSRSRALRLGAVAVALLYVAIGYRISLLPDDLNYFGPLSTYPPRSTLGETLPGQAPVTYKINARGFREPDFAESKQDGVLRIVLVGDSFVFGIGVDYEGTLRPHLQAELGRRWPQGRFDILNLGLPGNNLASHVTLVETAIARLRPDVVILALTLANDLSAWDEQDARRDARRYGAYSFARFLVGDSVESLWALMFLDRTTTAAGLERLDVQMRRLEQILRDAEPRPMLVLFGFQPWDPPVAERLRKVADAVLVPNRATTTEDFIPGDGHPTSFGNRRSAAHIAKTLAADPTWLSLLGD